MATAYALTEESAVFLNRIRLGIWEVWRIFFRAKRTREISAT